MPAGGRKRTLEERTVASDVLARALTPERPRVTPGSWDCWPILRDPETPAAVARGELDDRLEELHGLARAHGFHPVELACRDRLGEG